MKNFEKSNSSTKSPDGEPPYYSIFKDKKILSIFGGALICASLLSACGDVKGTWKMRNSTESTSQDFATYEDCMNFQKDNPKITIAEGAISGTYYAQGCEYKQTKEK